MALAVQIDGEDVEEGRVLDLSLAPDLEVVATIVGSCWRRLTVGPVRLKTKQYIEWTAIACSGPKARAKARGILKVEHHP